MFKCQLVNIVLSFQSENLVVGVLAETLAIVARTVVRLDGFDSEVDLSVVALVDTDLVSELLAPGVDVAAEELVLGHEVVVLLKCALAPVLQKLDLVLILSHLGGGGSHGLKVLMLLSKLLTEFLFGV